MPSSDSSTKVVPSKFILPFILVTSLFALWGFANDVTNPLVAAFRDVFVISNAKCAWVQGAFYGGYGTMAIPAALFIRKFSYKAGVIVGLSLFAIGAALTLPATLGRSYEMFLVSLYVLTFGLAFLETTANPYILSMGPRKTATRRLNLAQAFNPMGSLTGMMIASFVILSNLQVEDYRKDVRAAQAGLQLESATSVEEIGLSEAQYEGIQAAAGVVDPNVEAWVAAPQYSEIEADAATGEYPAATSLPYDSLLREGLLAYQAGEVETFEGRTFQEMQDADLAVVRGPYLGIGAVVVLVLVLFAVTKIPDTGSEEDSDGDDSLRATTGRLFKNPRYIGGVIAQAFYVGAQIMCWTYIIQYAETNLGLDKATAQLWNVAAMVLFLSSRFICTFLLKYIDSSRLLLWLAVGGVLTTLGTIFLPGHAGLVSLVLVSGCMSLMFPTIYGMALENMGEDAKLGSAGLVFAIIGGALLTLLQGNLVDLKDASGLILGLDAVRFSFFLSVLCFVVIAIYSLLCSRGVLPRLPERPDHTEGTLGGGDIANLA